MGIIPNPTTFVPGTPIVASAMNANFNSIVAVVNGNIDDANVSQLSAGKITSGEFSPDRVPRLDFTKLPRGASGFLKAAGAGADPAYALVSWGDVQSKPAQATRWPTWDEVTSRPTTFPPAGHTHGAGDINSGRLGLDRLPTSGTANRVLKVGAANSSPTYSQVAFGEITGIASASQIPDLPASRITTGTFDVNRIPNLDTGIITTGTFSANRIPNLDADKITSGILAVARGGTGGNNAAAARTSLGAAAASHTHSAGDINSGRLDLARLPTSATANRFLKVGTASSTPAYSTVSWDDVQSKPSTFPPSAHSAALLTSGTVPAERLPATITGNKTFTGVVTASGGLTLPVI